MKRVLFVVCGLLLAAVLVAPAAGAQYVTPPGAGPTVGTTDNGVVTNDTPLLNTGPPTEVQAKQFARDISSTTGGFQLQWLWLLFAVALGLLFLILFRRRRDVDDEDFSGAQPV